MLGGLAVVVVSVLAVLLAADSAFGARSAVPVVGMSAGDAAMPEGLYEAVSAAIIDDIPESAYHISRLTTPSALFGEFEAYNPAQRLSAHFGKEGVRVSPGRDGSGAWEWGM